MKTIKNLYEQNIGHILGILLCLIASICAGMIQGSIVIGIAVGVGLSFFGYIIATTIMLYTAKEE